MKLYQKTNFDRPALKYPSSLDPQMWSVLSAKVPSFQLKKFQCRPVSPPKQNFQNFVDILDFEDFSRFKDTGGEGVGREVSDTS
jgi:hypothetical protein